ncbi:hypothetical protein [Kordiimonas marina]|uniref:hypothetical protein n=1 Tax=Kordiimonas marina TaxID=2872312 RepID=UPI001FF3479A|nr:hypothetical protein [Kordiimonas marina]MCJ9428332.1 hypothetical protein [Kordiimonas marina]
MGSSEGRVQQAGVRTKILFSPQPSWEPALRYFLPGLSLTFLPFDTPGLDPDAYDIVVPLSIEWERWLNQSAPGAFASRALFPSDEVISLCDDKVAFSRFMVAKGLGNYVPAIGGDTGYPYVLKQRHDVWGRYTKVIAEPADEAARLKELEPGEWFKQQFMPGRDEFTTHMLVSEGFVVFACTVKYEFAKDQHVHSKGDQPTRRSVVDHGHLYRLFAGILGLLGYEGLCCVDYKLADGVPKIFEINPRMGASLCYAAGPAMQSYQNAVARRFLSQQPEARRA